MDNFPKGYIPNEISLIENQIETSKIRKIQDLKLQISNNSLIYKDGKEKKLIKTHSILQTEILLKVIKSRTFIEGSEIFSFPADERSLLILFDLY